MRIVSLVVFTFLCLVTLAISQQHPAIRSWLINTTDIKGRHYIKGNAAPVQDTFSANVQAVQYSADYAYVRCSGIPAYVIGPYQDGNPALAIGRGYIFKIPLAPKENTGAKTAVGLGHVAVLVNGVPVYNYADARSYNNAGVWHQNAIVFERTGFDCAKGHPSPIMAAGPPTGGQTNGSYHHHQDPSAFNIASVKLSDVCDMYLADGLYVPDSSTHGPLIGFSFDGYPIYGAYGWVKQGGKDVVKLMKPSYRMRTMADRMTLPDGSAAASAGPTFTAQALGSYNEDFEYVAGSGDLDEHNGRLCITPEYPEGTYAYFATINASGNSVYPYVIGPTYRGVVVADNFPARGPGAASTNVKITEPVTTYVPTSTTPSVRFTTSPTVTATVASAYRYDAKAEANVAGSIVYALTTKPTGMTIDTATGTVTWPIPAEGRHDVSIRAVIVGDVISALQNFVLDVMAEATSVEQDDVPELKSVRIFPNPSSNLLIIQVTVPIPSSALVELVDLTGRLVRTTTIYQGSTMAFLDLQTVYAGSYVVRVTMHGVTKTFATIVGE